MRVWTERRSQATPLLCVKKLDSWVVAAHIFNPSIWEAVAVSKQTNKKEKGGVGGINLQFQYFKGRQR